MVHFGHDAGVCHRPCAPGNSCERGISRYSRQQFSRSVFKPRNIEDRGVCDARRPARHERGCGGNRRFSVFGGGPLYPRADDRDQRWNVHGVHLLLTVWMVPAEFTSPMSTLYTSVELTNTGQNAWSHTSKHMNDEMLYY